MQEDVTREGGTARFAAPPALGAHIRRRGEDLAAGSVALSRGTRLNAFQIGLAAAVDRDELLVARRPRVSILCTGEELRDPGSLELPGTIPDSNGPSLAALVTAAGAEAVMAPRTGDDLKSTEAAIRAALEGSDLLLTVGGVSVGEHDWVKAALANVGVELEFWKVAIRPGKPLAFGRFGQTSILGLPGNPVSAQLTFSLFGMPLLRQMQGDRRPVPARSHARLNSPLRQSPPGRTGFYRAPAAGGSGDHGFESGLGLAGQLGAGRRFVDPAGGQLGARRGRQRRADSPGGAVRHERPSSRLASSSAARASAWAAWPRACCSCRTAARR